MRRFISLLMLCMMAISMSAMPAKRGTFTHKQSDGTQLTLMCVGDENLHYYVNTNTQEKMMRGEDGDYYVISSTEMENMENRAQARRQAINAARVKRMNKNSRTTVTPNGMRRVGTIGNYTGSKKGLVILVNFTDKEMSHTQTELDNQFNEEGYTTGGHLGSVHDFFYDQSYKQFDLTFDVVGPVTVNNKMSYYGGNDSSGNDKYPATMVIEALKLVDNQVNFADYDWDGDGEVDQVYVIYAGYGEAYGASSSTIWPHEWQLSSAKQYSDGSGAQTLDGVTIDTYACSCELSGTSGSTLNGIGTACHEFSHCLGFPDFYDTSYAGGFGMNGWDLMDAGSYNGPNSCGEVPAGYTSYERMCAGWLTPTELSEAKTVTGMKFIGDSPEAYVIYNDKNSDEYILLENRQNEKWFKYVGYTYTTPHGLLAIHVDYDETAWENDQPNNTASHQRMSIIPASGTYGTKTTSSGQTYYTCTESHLKGHPFSGSSSYTSLTGTSNSSSGGKWFTACSTGSTTLNHEVTEIANADDGTISFLFDSGAAVDDGSRYTITYNKGTGTCATTTWTQTDFQEKATLPTATSPSADWEFIGWSTTEYAEESATAPTVYAAGAEYQPTADVTLHAIYKKTEAGTGASGSYTLDYSAETKLQSTTLGYGNAVTYTATDGGTWVVKAYKNVGLQINKGKNASIKVPECPGNISTIEVTDGTARVLKFSATDYTGSNTPTAAATSSSSTSATLDLTNANLTTGYIYTTDGTTVITKIVVNYGAGTAYTYYTYPSDVEKSPLASISVTTPPTYTEYNEGESFKKDGMVVTATYEDGTTKTVTNYTISPDGALTASDNTITISYTEGGVTKTTTVAITVSELPKYTVTFNAGNGTCETESLTESAYQSGVTLPTATSSVDGWTFVGWATESVEDTSTKPTLLSANATYQPTADVTLYAVYSSSQSSTSGTSYQYTETFTAGKTYLFVSSKTAGSAYVIDAANLSTTGTKSATGTDVTINTVNDIPTITSAASTAEWTASGSTSSMQFKNGSNYMVINGNGMSLNTSSKNVYWSESYGLYGKSSSGNTKYYVKTSGTRLFAIDSSNGSTSKRVYMFQKVEGTITSYYATKPGVFMIYEETSEATESTNVTDWESIQAEYPNAIAIVGESLKTWAETEGRTNVVVKSGDEYTCSDFVLTDKTPIYVPNDFTATTGSYTRTGSKQWGTICLPFAVASSDDIHYYKLQSVSTTEMTFEEVSSVEANQPAVYSVGENGGDITMTFGNATIAQTADNNVVTDDLTLIGVQTETVTLPIGSGNYYIANNKFWRPSKNAVTVAPQRAYFATSSQAKATSYSIEISGGYATAIDALFGNSESLSVEGYYDINGAQQNGLHKGINIVKFSNGTTKKVIIK